MYSERKDYLGYYKMSLDYEKRLKELRRLDFMDDYQNQTTQEKEDGFMKRRVVETETQDEKNPLQKFQENAFMQIMFLNRELKEKISGTI